MSNIIQFPKSENDGIDFLLKEISAGMIPPNDPEDTEFDELADEIETLFYSVSTNQLPHSEAAGILISRLAGTVLLDG